MSNESLKKMVTAMAYNDEETARKMFQQHFNTAAVKYMSDNSPLNNVVKVPDDKDDQK